MSLAILRSDLGTLLMNLKIANGNCSRVAQLLKHPFLSCCLFQPGVRMPLGNSSACVLVWMCLEALVRLVTCFASGFTKAC